MSVREIPRPKHMSPQELRDVLRKEGRAVWVDPFGRVMEESLDEEDT